ncbi:MAG TPA: radical SAM family heme chaperone HemW [Burkholderiaceae bacterium]|nr:radical SAM family heme chaperone HemW [Burkholderiaceae bacterium]
MSRTFSLLPESLLNQPGKGPDGSQQLLNSLPPLSLYIHVPWCVRKCPYCDFNSHEWQGEELPERDYLEALRADLEQALPNIWGRQIYSVFIGGGTPSLLSAQAVDEMLATLRAYLNIWSGAEITLEANPGTAEAQRFKDYAHSGINRLSLGIQSFNDRALQALGRIHDGIQAHNAIEMALKAVERVNLDLMFALPEQNLEACLDDLEQAMAYQPGHLSLYNLTLEPNTVFAKYPPPLPSDDEAATMQDALAEKVQAGGWTRYEVSAYAQKGQQSLHNTNYWEFGDYLGVGPGAHSKLSFHDKIIRQVRRHNPNSWMSTALKRDNSHLSQDQVISRDELPFEFMLNALRLKEGVAAASFHERTGIPLRHIQATINQLVDKGLFTPNPARLQATDLGWRFLNDVQSAFL